MSECCLGAKLPYAMDLVSLPRVGFWDGLRVLAEITSTLGLILVLFLFFLGGAQVLEYANYGYKVIELQFEHTFIKSDIIFIRISFHLRGQGSGFLLILLF